MKLHMNSLYNIIQN